MFFIQEALVKFSRAKLPFHFGKKATQSPENQNKTSIIGSIGNYQNLAIQWFNQKVGWKIRIVFFLFFYFLIE